MAFDIYVGPASRYQAGNWKNIGQQIAEEQGLQYHMIRPREGLLQRLLHRSNPAKVYEQWREQIKSSLAGAGFNDAVWDDSPKQDYVTDRPGWEGHVAFVAQFAYARNPQLTPPSKALSMPEFAEDPAFEVELKLEDSPVIALLSTHFFLPTRFNYVFTIKNFAGNEAGVASIDLIDHAIDRICDHCKLDRTSLAKMILDQIDGGATFEEAAKYGTSIYSRMANEALSRNLPLILDF